MKTEFLDNFWNTHNTHILFVSKNEKGSILKFVFWKHLLEFFSGNIHSFFVRWVNNIDESLGVLIVVLPQLSDLILSSDIPDCEFDLLELDGLDVESDGGYWRDNFS